MAAQDLTGYASALKVLYPTSKIEKLSYGSNVWFALVPKDPTFYGKSADIPVTIADITGANQDFSQAVTDKAGSTINDFSITRKKEYALASVDGETMEASQRDAGAFVSAIKSELDSAFRKAGLRIGQALYGDGSGQLAEVGSSSGSTITLANIDDIVNFALGQKIVFAADNTSALRDSGDDLVVSGIDEDTGVLTFTEAASTISGLTNGDAMFTLGDYASASDRNRISGLGAWVPTTAPATSDSFFGLNRSTYPTALAGHRIVGTALQIDEALMKAAVRVARAGGMPDTCLVNHSQYEQLVNILGSKVTYVDHDLGAVGFTSIRIIGPAGPLDVFADFNCPVESAYVLQRDTWKLMSLNKAPHILGLEQGDGLRWLRESSSDAYEIRVGAYAQLACTAPKWNATVSLTVPT